jgi:small GTP-binding protein
MGFVQSKVLERPKTYRTRILMLGLDSAGKTTLLYNIITGEELSTKPTMGFNVEELFHPNKKFALEIWDIGGQKSIRRLWRHYYNGAQV